MNNSRFFISKHPDHLNGRFCESLDMSRKTSAMRRETQAPCGLSGNMSATISKELSSRFSYTTDCLRKAEQAFRLFYQQASWKLALLCGNPAEFWQQELRFFEFDRKPLPDTGKLPIAE